MLRSSSGRFVAKRHKPGLRQCAKCRRWKSPRSFHRRFDRGKGWQSHCMDCKREIKRARRRKLVVRSREKEQNRLSVLKAVYGLSAHRWAKLMRAQKGRCAICGKKETSVVKGGLASLSVDHNHRTGRIRGLLCRKCNTGLGMFKDSVKTMKAAITYLRRNRHGNTP